MPRFLFTAKTASGRKLSNIAIAEDKEGIRARVEAKGLTLVTARDISGTNLFNAPPADNAKVSDLVLFTRQLATMIGAGISLLEALEILKEQAERPGFMVALDDIIEDVRGGADLSISLGKHPKIFKAIYINMIKAGEASGQLEDILTRLAEYQEAAEELKSEIKSAMTYPVISLCLVLGITIFLMVGIVPKFKSIFDGLGVELPFVTQMILDISLYMRDNFIPGALFSGIVFFTLFMFVKKTYIGAKTWDYIMLKVPIFGPLFQKVAISRFARTFSTLLQSGVPILGALDIVGSTSGNILIEEVVVKAKDSIRQGSPLERPLSESWVFPPMVVRMVGIGEKSGAMETLLNKISEFYDQQVKHTVAALTSLIEPLLISMMGGMVGTIVLAIFLPIFKIQESLR